MRVGLILLLVLTGCAGSSGQAALQGKSLEHAAMRELIYRRGADVRRRVEHTPSGHSRFVPILDFPPPIEVVQLDKHYRAAETAFEQGDFPEALDFIHHQFRWLEWYPRHPERDRIFWESMTLQRAILKMLE
jgi:hypothetical protein